MQRILFSILNILSTSPCSILIRFSPILKPRQISTTEEFAKLFELLSQSSRRPEDDPLEKWWNEQA